MKVGTSGFLQLGKIALFVVTTSALLTVSSCATKPEKRFGLSEEKRMKIFEELVSAEDRVWSEVPLEPMTTKSPQVGQSLMLTKEIPLMPELEPVDPVAALQQVERLPVDTTVKVLQVSEKDGVPWYYVEVAGSSETRLDRGWINSIALVEQSSVDFEELKRRRIELKRRILDEHKSDMARKYGLTLEQLEEISKEGDEKVWPP